MKWHPYPAYKDSGVEWLGEIPANWEVIRLKYSAQLINEKVEGNQSKSLYTGLEHIESWTGKRIDTKNEVTCEGQANTHKKGDVLFGKLRPYLAKVHAAETEGICTGELLVLRPRFIECHFLQNYLLNPDFISLVDSSTYGAKMPRANWDYIGNLPSLVPPQEEQTTIAAFLDRETARIDALIAKKQRQIELLQEKRAALISHAVTKGLNPNAKMKDSGIEWLGEIPAHWKIMKLGFLCDLIQTGPFGSQLHASDYVDDGTPIINPANIQNGRIIPDTQCTVDEQTVNRLIRHRLSIGDIVFARRGDMGRCALVREDADGFLCGTGCLKLVLSEDIVNPDFIDLYLGIGGVKDHLSLESVGSTMENLNTGILSRLPIAVPPLREQDTIQSIISSNIMDVHDVMKTIVSSVQGLQEYRTALISAAVTGKIDVRQEAT